MANDHVDTENLRITGAHKAVDAPNVDIKNDVVIIITQLFGPRGDNLVGISGVEFDGYPAVSVGVRTPGGEGIVHLSPIHGDNRKSGFTDIAVGTVCELFCPVSKQPLDLIGDIEGDLDAQYYALYLTPARTEGSVVMISNVWGHYHSRIVDNFELISHWANEHDEL